MRGFSSTDVLAALTRFSGRIESDLAYGPHPRHRLDVYHASVGVQPRGVPAVLFFYGGSWHRGERADYRFVGKALAAKGITTIVADYRLYPEVRFPDFLDDSARAAHWLIQHAQSMGCDVNRLFVMGHSAGAYNAAMLAFDPQWVARHGGLPDQQTPWAGFVGLAGPYEFLPITNEDAKPVFHHPHYPPGTQPIELVSPSSPATLLITARADDLVNPLRNSAAMAQRLTQNGVAVQHLNLPRVNHMTLVGALAPALSWLAPVGSAVVAFLHQTHR